ncbi:MAG: FG-GAP repeat protein, partial [Anaerolineae bacterium]|nr:FG-GAP repeat protein [Anaerolineae bacterium]
VKLADIEGGAAGGRPIHNTLEPTCDIEVVGVGDLNGDGFADLAAASYIPDESCSSRAFVVLGEPASSGAIELDATLANVIAIDSPDWSLDGPRGVGDVNGDGFDDLSVREGSLFIGGTSYVFFGGSPLESRTTVELAGGQGGVAIGQLLGFDEGAIRGSGVGDVNGDGVDDLLVAKTSAPYDTSQYARVLFGAPDLAADGPG